MGICFSFRSVQSASATLPETATVVAVNGELRDYPTPIKVQQVLTTFTTQASENAVCNSDSLSYDELIPAMKPDELLQPNQIYFLVPTSRLQYRLSATDMAAMAVKASVAMQKRDGRRKKARISPVSDSYRESRVQEETITPFSRKRHESETYSRSGSIRRLQRYSSRRAKLAVRSFRLMLSTIYE